MNDEQRFGEGKTGAMLQKVPSPMRHFLFLAYSASAVTFAAGLLRDWVIIQQTFYAKSFFELLYFSSLVSGFVINAITLGGGQPTLSFVLLSTASTLFVAAAVGSIVLSHSAGFIAISCAVIVFWIIGTVASRSLICAEKVFRGRVREGVASVATCILVFAGTDLGVTFLVGVAIGTAWALWVSREHRGTYLSVIAGNSPWRTQFQALMISNLAGTGIFVWALVLNRSSDPLWGVDPTIAVRFSVYLFQVLSIGAVIAVVRMPRLSIGLKRHSLAICMSSLVVASIVAVTSSSVAVLVMPLLAAVAHYSGVAYLHRHSPVRN